MKIVDLNAKWHIATESDDAVGNLPYDVTAHAARDFTCAFGEMNGYVPAARAVFTKEVPAVKSGKAYLCVSGALGYGDVSVNGETVGRIHGRYPYRFDVTGLLDGAHNEMSISLVSVPGMSDKYVGLGIGGGVSLVIVDDIDIEYGSLFVTTESAGDKVYADVELSVKNDTDVSQKMTLDCTLLNGRGKRCGKKQRKIFVRARSSKSFTVRVRINKGYEWTLSDPYTYTATVSVKAEGSEDEHSASVRFGVVSRSLNAVRGLYINNKNTDLFGAYVSHADAVLGGASVYSNEKRRFEALKTIGYNAVHFVECPTEAALNALDDIGMYAYVDIFGAFSSGKAPLDAHIFGEATALEESILALRNHPCVTLYGVADDVPECYGRNDGYAVIEEGASLIRSLDSTRPVTVSAREFVPTAKELENAGVKRRIDSEAAAINAGREKDLFNTLTEPAFAAVDVCGFNYLYPLYGSDKILQPQRIIVGSRTDPERAFESVEETERNLHVIGDFSDCGIDYPGGGRLNEVLCSRGDLDAIGDDKIQGAHKRIILGGRNLAYIAVLDPETEEPVCMWNWPRYLGKPVTVKVYTSGDVAALYLDGRLIGRKLAGKVNRHIATFTTEYYPGTLETICYFKGVECARARLKTAGSPKSIRLTAYDKSLSLSRGDVGFLYVDVCDRDGNLVPYAMRTLTAQVAGAELCGFVNGDPMLRKTSFDSCPAYNGRAFIAIRPTEEGKVVVKVSGDGLLASKISFKVKE